MKSWDTVQKHNFRTLFREVCKTTNTGHWIWWVYHLSVHKWDKNYFGEECFLTDYCTQTHCVHLWISKKKNQIIISLWGNEFNWVKESSFPCTPGNRRSCPEVQTPLVGYHCHRGTFKVTLTGLSLSWGSRRGDTPRAGALRKCWGPLRRWQVLLRNFPVQRSPLKCRRWQCCWNCPAGAQRKLILKSPWAGITYPVYRQNEYTKICE